MLNNGINDGWWSSPQMVVMRTYHHLRTIYIYIYIYKSKASTWSRCREANRYCPPWSFRPSLGAEPSTKGEAQRYPPLYDSREDPTKTLGQVKVYILMVKVYGSYLEDLSEVYWIIGTISMVLVDLKGPPCIRHAVVLQRYTDHRDDFLTHMLLGYSESSHQWQAK